MSEGRMWGGGGTVGEASRSVSESGLHSSRDSPRHYYGAETVRVSDRLNPGREGGGREKMVKVSHDINKCMVCISVPVGL